MKNVESHTLFNLTKNLMWWVVQVELDLIILSFFLQSKVYITVRDFASYSETLKNHFQNSKKIVSFFISQK